MLFWTCPARRQPYLTKPAAAACVSGGSGAVFGGRGGRYNREDYATIDNAGVFDIEFGDLSCTLTPQTVPAGWRLADWDASVAFVSPRSPLQRSDITTMRFEVPRGAPLSVLIGFDGAYVLGRHRRTWSPQAALSVNRKGVHTVESPAPWLFLPPKNVQRGPLFRSRASCARCLFGAVPGVDGTRTTATVE